MKMTEQPFNSFKLTAGEGHLSVKEKGITPQKSYANARLSERKNLRRGEDFDSKSVDDSQQNDSRLHSPPQWGKKKIEKGS